MRQACGTRLRRSAWLPRGVGQIQWSDRTVFWIEQVQPPVAGAVENCQRLIFSVDSGVLTVRAERREEKKEGGQSEFWYGSLTRSVTLPPGADEERVTASYCNGILEVKTALKEEKKPEPRRIAISKE
jgi:Hsp20/alpha crystallin family